MFNLQMWKTSDEKEYEGKIIINDLCKYFYADGGFCDINFYKKQWLKAASEILKNDTTYFLTNISDPEYTELLMGWTAYRFDKNIYMQNLFFLKEFFNLAKVISMEVDTPEFSQMNEDGDEISTWKITVEDMIKYKESLEKGIVVL